MRTESFNRNRYTYIVSLLCVLIAGSSKAQDPIFSQFYNNPVYYNPANIGLNMGVRARFNYRDQWVGLPEHYRTYNFTLDASDRSLLGFGGLGLLVLSDKVGSGLFRTNTVGIAPSMRVFTGQKSVLQAGIMVSYNQKMLNWDGLVYSDQLHSRYGNIYTTDFSIPDRNKVTYPDFSFGGVYRYQNNRPGTNDFQATFGLGVHHAFEPNESFMNLNSRLPRKLVIHGDFVIELGQLGSGFRKSKYSGSLKINPAFIYEKQKEFASFTAGVNGFYENVFGGLWFRNQAADLFQTNTFIINAGIYFPFNEETNIKVMYSYDLLALNELRTAAKGTHEVSLVWEFGEFSLFGGRNSGPRNFSSGDRGFECSPFD